MATGIFDRMARRRAMRRASSSPADARWLHTIMADDLAERLAATMPDFPTAIVIGATSPQLDSEVARRSGRVLRMQSIGEAPPSDIGGDEDRLPLRDSSVDLIINCGMLDTVEDLPGALVLARRAIRPGGLFMANFVGAISLPCLRSAISSTGSSVARIHPQIDLRGAGDLMTRAGFSQPVVDADTFTARYSDLATLVSDLRAMGMQNVLAQRVVMSRNEAGEIAAAFQAFADADGKIAERFTIINVSGWVPVRDEVRPAGPTGKAFPVQ